MLADCKEAAAELVLDQHLIQGASLPASPPVGGMASSVLARAGQGRRQCRAQPIIPDLVAWCSGTPGSRGRGAEIPRWDAASGAAWRVRRTECSQRQGETALSETLGSDRNTRRRIVLEVRLAGIRNVHCA